LKAKRLYKEPAVCSFCGGKAISGSVRNFFFCGAKRASRRFPFFPFAAPNEFQSPAILFAGAERLCALP